MIGHLLTVGDEILLGQVVDTNAAWLGERLAAAGLDLRRSETVGDDHGEIVRALERAYADGAAVVVVTGGLGPTHDDVTKAAVAEVFGRELEFRPDVLERIEARYATRGRSMPAVGRVMAEVPVGFDALPNPTGSAPGLWGEGEGRMVAVMPGVPHEMEAIASGSVLPRLVERQDGVVLSRTLLTAGKGESDLSEMIEAAVVLPDSVRLAYLPSTGQVRIRLTARGPSRDVAQADLDAGFETVRGAVGRLAFGEGETTLEAVVLDAFRAAGRTLAVAESCTGGTVLSRLTAIPGASAVVCGGVVAYSNAAKRDLLGVPEAHLDDHGAVSEPVALALAAGARERLGADVGLSTTGIAGPTGGTPDKPVGTVWIAYDDGAHARAVRLQLTPNRAVNIALSTTAVLDLARRQLARQADS